MALTHRAAMAANEPGTKLADSAPLPGGGRLVLIVRGPAKKSWVLRSRRAGRDTSVKIGEFPDLSIADARTAAREIATGGRPDPRVPGGSLRALIEAYIESLGERPSARDARWAAGWLLGRDWSHELARRPAHLVEPHELAELLRGHAQAGATTSVNRARSMLSAAFAFGARIDLDPRRPAGVPRFAVKSNPVALIPRIGEFEQPRSVVIEQRTLKEIWRTLVQLGPEGAFGRLALLSLQRLKQLQAAQIDRSTLLIRDTKGRAAQEKFNRLPIPPAMAAALRDGALDLPGGYAALNLTLRPYGLRATDLRRTAETFLSDRGVSGGDRGHLLSHGLERNPLVRRHYDRAERLDRKAELLAMWQAYATTKAPKRERARNG